MFQKKLCAFSLIAFCLWATAAGADTLVRPAPEAEGSSPAAESRTLTLEQTLDLALRTNTTYLAQIEKERQAQSRWWQAVLALGPSASLQAGYLLDHKTLDSFAAMGISVPGLSTLTDVFSTTPYYSGRLTVSQPLFTGGKLLNALNLAALQREIATDQVKVTRTQLRLDVTRAFFNVLVSEQLVKVTQASLDSMQKHLDIVLARYREGSASNFEVLRARVQIANLQPTLLKMRTALTLARSQLAALTGLALDERLKLSGSLKTQEEVWPGQPELTARALAARLELRNLARAQRMAEIGHTLAWTSNAPMLALSAAWTYVDYQDQHVLPQSDNLFHGWELTLGLSWPFWDNLAAIPKTCEAASQVQEAALGRKALEDGIRLDVESSYLAMTTARQTIDAQSQTVALARESVRLAEDQYRNGMATNLDVLDAQIALNQAEINYLQAQFEYAVAGVKLHQAVGDLF